MSHIVLELAAASGDVARCRALGKRIGGCLYADAREGQPGLPFRALLTTVTDHLEALAEVADVGLYLVAQRTIRPGAAGVYGLFPMVRQSAKSHAEADAHWRDVHAPLALRHHGYMSHYVQLSVVHRLQGARFDGFALCGFPTLEDLRERFFSTEDGPKVIAADVARFADTQRSPRRLIATATRWAPPAG